MLNKKAYSIQMNLPVPMSEKNVAKEARAQFDKILSQLSDAAQYLWIIYDPFYTVSNPDMNMVVNYRKTFRQYRDQVRFKFSQISNRADKCVVLMKEFASDSTTEEMMEAFMGMMRELQKYIDIFVSIFSNLNSAEFRNHLISTIDSIKKQMNQIRQLINDRILEHIDNNILAKDWASEISEQSDIVVEEKIPLVLQLFRERQKALKG